MPGFKAVLRTVAETPLVGRWTIASVRARAAAVWREGGAAHLWFKILGETVYRRAHLLECVLANAPRAPEPTVPVEVRPLRDDEIHEYLAARPDADARAIRDRLAAGHRCLVARCDGRIVHAVWATTTCGWIEYLSREIQLERDEVYLYEAFSTPAVRGRRIAGALLAGQIGFFRDAGFRRALAIVMPENESARRWVIRAGFRQIGLLRFLKLGPWRWNFGRVPRCVAATAMGADRVSSASAWDDTVDRFAGRRHYLNGFLGELKASTYLQLIERWGGLPASGRVLKTDLFEEALGPDAFFHALSRQGATAIGMDLSVDATKRARARRRGGSRYLAADSRRLPFCDGAFALIVSPSTLDHFGDPGDLCVSLRELARVLEPGGRLIITLDNRQNISDPLLRLVHRLGWVPFYLGRSYRIDELRRELAAAGFKVESTTAILHNPRLAAVAAAAVADRLGWRPFTRAVERAIRVAQRLEDTRLCYFTGSFIAAQAVKPERRGA